MSLFSSLTNRIFLASAVLVLVSIAVPIYLVNVAVTRRSNDGLRRGLDETAALVDDYVGLRFNDFVQLARNVADLPKLKAAVAENDPPTVEPIALDYQRKIAADLFVVTSGTGRVLAAFGDVTPDPARLDEMLRSHLTGRETTWFWPYSGGVLKVAAVPLAIAPGLESLGTLVVGFRLDQAAQRIKELTNSDIAVVAGPRIVTSTLDAARTADLTGAINERGVFDRRLDGEEFIARVQPLGSADDPVAIVLRSRAEQRGFLRQLQRNIAAAGVLAVLVGTLLGYAIARTVTRPLRAVTATMREMAATGDLARTVPTVRRWDDEDAQLLASTFRQLTTALDRFQRESAQRERLAALGRLSTVIAHEVRNPLMIIKTGLRSLRRHQSPDVVDVAVSIDEEVSRINRVVSDVLDFVRPIRFDVAEADLNQVCRDAAHAARAGPNDASIVLEAAEPQATIVTDAQRLRGVLVNVLTNAQHAVHARGANGQAVPPIQLRTIRAGGGRWRIEVADRGTGIAPEDLPRLFEPFFTTRRTGSGLGLALARNVIEGLGGSIAVYSQVDVGTTVRIDLPDQGAGL